MKILSTLALSLVVIFDFIELSLPFDLNVEPTSDSPRTSTPHPPKRNLSLQFDLNVEPNPDSPCTGTSQSPKIHHSYERTNSRTPSAELHPAESSAKNTANLNHPKLSPLRMPSDTSDSKDESPPARCTVTPARLPSPNMHGYGFKYFEYIRLTSYANPNWIFKLRRYTFPSDRIVKLQVGHNAFKPVPDQEHIVISTFDGDVFAILESTNILAGLYVHHIKYYKRAKIDKQGMVTLLTPIEIKEIPVGSARPIQRYFQVTLTNEV
ncbi:uncharacterized protein LOC117170090 [Belonocnema kinseyi]|uniref:uncharacterized protein LOC117170090 n=1 Tax=Belonocnema kinseyi TaxID=2817044 RepID=UPI00143DC81C|nr:uncharacterized protein LOC117170090 [Belonocnema kinseyi]